jgi:hypothetical protein
VDLVVCYHYIHGISLLVYTEMHTACARMRTDLMSRASGRLVVMLRILVVIFDTSAVSMQRHIQARETNRPNPPLEMSSVPQFQKSITQIKGP